jgi:hypothetical protein
VWRSPHNLSRFREDPPSKSVDPPGRDTAAGVTEAAYGDQRSSQFRNARGSIIKRVNVASLRQHDPPGPRPGDLIPSRTAKQRDPAPGPRLRARPRCERLDREIAAGLPTAESPARAIRASQLTSASMRHTLAAPYANILDTTEECHADPGSPLTVGIIRLLSAGQARCATPGPAGPLFLVAAADMGGDDGRRFTVWFAIGTETWFQATGAATDHKPADWQRAMTAAVCTPLRPIAPTAEREERPDRLAELLECMADLLVETRRQRMQITSASDDPRAREAIARLTASRVPDCVMTGRARNASTRRGTRLRVWIS